MTNDTIRTVIWVNSAKEELLEFPEDVIDEVGYILYRVQTNQTHPNRVFEKSNLLLARATRSRGTTQTKPTYSFGPVRDTWVQKP